MQQSEQAALRTNLATAIFKNIQQRPDGAALSIEDKISIAQHASVDVMETLEEHGLAKFDREVKRVGISEQLQEQS